MSSAQTIYNIEVARPDGTATTLADYRNKVLLLVNVASECGFTQQYEALEALYRDYKKDGLEILAFPSNDFGGQEPGTMEDIEQFCKLNYGVTFPLFQKLHAIGQDKHPLYKWLTEEAGDGGEVKWNFEKFLISRQGEIISRYESKITPDALELLSDLKQAL